MRRAAHVDSTQKPICDALRAVGADFMRITCPDRKGCWDLLVGFRGRDFKLEVKGPNTPLSDEQLELHRTWPGAKSYVVRTPEEALAALGLKASHT